MWGPRRCARAPLANHPCWPAAQLPARPAAQPASSATAAACAALSAPGASAVWAIQATAAAGHRGWAALPACSPCVPHLCPPLSRLAPRRALTPTARAARAPAACVTAAGPPYGNELATLLNCACQADNGGAGRAAAGRGRPGPLPAGPHTGWSGRPAWRGPPCPPPSRAACAQPPHLPLLPQPCSCGSGTWARCSSGAVASRAASIQILTAGRVLGRCPALPSGPASTLPRPASASNWSQPRATW